MNHDSLPKSIDVSLAALVGVGVEYSRLANWLAAASPGGKSDAPARHALRRIEDFLKLCELEVRGMDGHPFDAGLAVHVIDTVDDPELAEGKATIIETLSPMVLWRGQVVKNAEVVTRRGTGK